MVMTPARAPTVAGQRPRRPWPRLYPTGMKEERTLFTTAEAAAMLGITHDAAKMAVRVGTLPVERINPRLNMVTRAAIEAYRRDHLGREGRPKGAKNKPKGSTAAGAPPARGAQATKTKKAAAHDAIDEGHTRTESPASKS